MDSHERMHDEIMGWETLAQLGLDADTLERQYADFKEFLSEGAILAKRGHINIKMSSRSDYSTLDALDLRHAIALVHELGHVSKNSGNDVLDVQLKHAFYARVAASRFTAAELRSQRELADLRYPLEWFGATRKMKRKFHVHVGPTNSGKTYHALKALENAERGMYGGPLRLLAHEVFTRLNVKRKKTMLVTGEERRLPEGEEDARNIELVSCTVEMCDIHTRFDVAVIDEIQMIGHAERGWAWTQAVLGIRANEIHLCGEERAVPIITALVAMMGDEMEVHRYERLTPLAMDLSSFNGDISKLRKNDCIVCFSVLNIHALRNRIEQETGKKVAIVYGSLPPETRSQQAALFNDPHNDYDFLVASDAIGMGLNLSIKRIIFESSQKIDNGALRPLRISEIKQIAGRAGRFRTSRDDIHAIESNLDASPPEVEPTTEVIDTHSLRARSMMEEVNNSPGKALHRSRALAVATEVDEREGTDKLQSQRQHNADPHSGGLVSALHDYDWSVVREGLRRDAEPIKSAGILPPPLIVRQFAAYFPYGTPFSYILLRLHEIAKKHERFHLCTLKDQVLVADAIQSVDGLSIDDRLTFCAAPCGVKDPHERSFLKELAQCLANRQGGELLSLNPANLDLGLLGTEAHPKREYLKRIERLHKQIGLYLWLSYRFSGVFTSRNLAFYVKSLVERKFEQALAKFSFTEEQLRRRALLKEQSVLLQQMKQQSLWETEQSEQEESNSVVDSPLGIIEGAEEEAVDEEDLSEGAKEPVETREDDEEDFGGISSLGIDSSDFASEPSDEFSITSIESNPGKDGTDADPKSDDSTDHHKTAEEAFVHNERRPAAASGG